MPTSGNFVQRHAEAVSLLHNVEVLHAVGDPNQTELFVFDDQVINGVRTLVVYYRKTKIPVINFLRRMKAYFLGFPKMKKPNLVHANVMRKDMLFAVYLKKRYGLPFVVSEHWSGFREVNQHTISFLAKRVVWLIGNQASFVIPVSEDLQKGLQTLGVVAPTKVIPNVVDTEVFQPIKRAINKRFTFLHVSNLVPLKNADKILQSFLSLLKQGYPFSLQIGGDGDTAFLYEKVKNSEFGEYVEIFGIQTYQEVADRMKKADCFILFSNTENQPCVIAESFATGLKVISTNVGGISEYFPVSAGILLPEVDVKLLENAMIEIYENRNLDDKENIVHYAEVTFSKRSIAQNISEVYYKILDPK